MDGSDLLNISDTAWISPPYMYSVPQELPATVSSDAVSRNSSVSGGVDGASTSGSSGITYSAPPTPNDDVPLNGTNFSYFDPLPGAVTYNQATHPRGLLHSQYPLPGMTRGTIRLHMDQGLDKTSSYDWQTFDQASRHSSVSSPRASSSFGNTVTSVASQGSSLDSIVLGPDTLQSPGSWSSSNVDTTRAIAPSSVQIPSSLSPSFYSTAWEDEFMPTGHHRTVNPSDTLSSFGQTHIHYMDSPHYVDGYGPPFDGTPSIDMGSSSFLESSMAADPRDRQMSLSLEDQQSSRADSQSPPDSTTHTTGSNAAIKRRSPRAKKRAKSMARKHTFVQGLGWVASEPARNDRIPCSFNCGQKFNRREHCTRHEKMHTNERPYICSLALNSGSAWCKIQEEKNDGQDSRKKKSKGIGRSDNQFQHYVTHLKWRHEGRKTRNNKCADKTFLYWIIWRHEGQRAYRVFDMVEAQMRKHDTPLGEPNYELMTKHPEWPDYVAWRESGGTLLSLGYEGRLQE